jgi:hypothetical protein
VANKFDGSTNSDPTGRVNPSNASRQDGGGRRLRPRVLVIGIPVVIIAAILLALVLHGASHPSTNAGAANAGASQSTPTPTAVPKVVYQADWMHAASSWTLPAHWHLVDGQIENDGYGTEPLMVPYSVTSPDYSIEADLTVQSVPNYPASHSYGIEGLNGGGQLQFVGQICCIRQGVANAGFSEIYVAHADSLADTMSEEDYTVSRNTESFVITVQHNNLGFCPGVSCLSNLNSSTPLWPMHIAIVDIGVQLTLTRLVITSP